MNLTNALQQVTDKVVGWVEQLIALLPNLAVAILVVVVFGLLSRLVRELVNRTLGRVASNKQVNRLLASTAMLAVLSTGVFIALSILELDGAVTTLLAGVGIIGLALGFAFQDIVSNFMSGVLLAIRRPFQEGDLIQSQDTFGIVDQVNLRATVVRTLDGPLVFLPNSSVFQNAIINYTARGERRVDVSVGVSYNDDLEEAQRLAIQAVESIEGRDANRDVEVFYESFGDSSINFILRFWISFQRQPQYLKARSEAIIRVKKAFDAHGISIPFPIRTLDFDLSASTTPLNIAMPNRSGESNGASQSTPSDRARQNES